MIVPVHLDAHWKSPDGALIVNVGNRMLAVALMLDGTAITAVLVVRKQYMGSSHHPVVQSFTEWVDFELVWLEEQG